MAPVQPGGSLDLASILEAQAERHPDRVFLRMSEGDFTFGQFNEMANRIGQSFLQRGVQPREFVVLMLPNSLEFMLTWFGLLKIGAVVAPVNISFKGPGLRHLVNLTEARTMVIDSDYAPVIGEIAADLEHVSQLFVRGDASEAAHSAPSSWAVADWNVLDQANAENPTRDIAERDLAMLLFTSGTTGPSKACMLTHRYIRRNAEVMIENFGFVPDDCLYCPYPLFHADAAVFTVVPALLLGARAAIGVRFSASRFWDEVRRFGATVFDYMGATLTILWKQEPRPDDRNNEVRLAWGVPTPDFWKEFEDRFGLKLAEVYGLTDAGLVAYESVDAPHREGSCGRPVHPYDVRILDQDGFEAPRGQLGEIVIRPLEPSVVMKGYYRMPEATLDVFRGLWLHTGDQGWMDEDGYLYFSSRLKDAVRRRGENISAYEIEQVLESHELVLEAAVVGVASELTEEDVKACVALRPGAVLSPQELITFCEDRMAYFTVPRYVEFMDSLPKTPTQKVQKHLLKEAGVTENTWDREAQEEARDPAERSADQ
jgi:crotonobetaine/carnitine-CoA ligase